MLVPGDILYYDGYHVMMVDSINTSDGTILTSEVNIIESTWGEIGIAGATKIKTLKKVDDANPKKNWKLGRLRIDE